MLLGKAKANSNRAGFQSNTFNPRSQMRMSQKSTFRNVKLGKNVYRQMKRRGPPVPPPSPRRQPKVPPKPHQ
jgi:hypothetical protein